MDKIDELLTRGVAEILPTKKELEKELRSGKKLRVYEGFDPTGDELHIGHMIGLRKLKQLQALGHHVIFLIGDMTVKAGDPSGKKNARDKLYKLIVEVKEDKPGTLRKIAEAFEIENVNMTAIDSHRAGNSIKFKVGIDKLTPVEKISKSIKLLIDQGFSVTDEFRQNAKNYIEQAGKIVNFKGPNPAEIHYNSDWLNQLSLIEMLNIVGHFSLQQLSERDLFQERLKRKETVNLQEFLYPLLQGYDSVAMNIDLEIGGTDQTFNMLCGRTLVKTMQNREKFILTTPLLTDAQGNKIGKTEGNAIAITDNPEDLFGKIMTLPDEVIVKGLEYLTDLPMDEIKNIEKKIKEGTNPIEFKKRLAFEIVKQLNDEKSAKTAQEHFGKTVQRKEKPFELKSIELPSSFISTASIAGTITASEVTSSMSETKRLIEQGGISVNDNKITDPNAPAKDYLRDGKIIIKKGKIKATEIKSSD